MLASKLVSDLLDGQGSALGDGAMLNAWSFGSASCRTRRIGEQIYGLSWRSLPFRFLLGDDQSYLPLPSVAHVPAGELPPVRNGAHLLAALLSQAAVVLIDQSLVGLDLRQVIGARAMALASLVELDRLHA